MLDTRLRPLKDRLITPLATVAGKWFTPNQLSVLAFIAGLACAVMLGLKAPTAAFILWVANRILDGLDGLVARSSGRSSDKGAYLDITLDFMVYALIPLAMIYADPALALSTVLLFAAFYINSASWMYLSALLEKRGRGAAARDEKTSITMPTGLIEGGETIVFYSLMILLPGMRELCIIVLAALTFAGALIRFAQGLRILQDPHQREGRQNAKE
ncbi:MAG: CDP-alcohol phosphatidyltransferase family protein [Spirochaetes bacterium]|nr:CDP-alcohol phosphatidyltransferase family protein [Spirochaetota bacterium]